MIIYFFEIPIVLILIVVVLIIGAMGVLQTYMQYLAIAVAVVVAIGELTVYYKLINHIRKSAYISNARHPILVGIYWLIAFFLNIVSSYMIIKGMYLEFQALGEDFLEKDVLSFSFELVVAFPFVLLIYAGALYVNRWLRTCFFEDKGTLILLDFITDSLYKNPQDSGIIGVFWYTIKIIFVYWIIARVTNNWLF